MRPRTVTADILAVLADVPCATVRKLAEDAACDVSSVCRALPGLLEKRLVEEAGPFKGGLNRPPMTYRLHPRLKGAPCP